ncbi:uncharacterized protein LOC144601015 isoform X2 [Rhinoraja longicauda]
MKVVILSSCLLALTLTFVSGRPRYSRYFRPFYPSYFPYTPYNRPPYYMPFPGNNYPGKNYPGFNYPGYGRVPVFNGFGRNSNPGAARAENKLVDEGSHQEYSLINVDSRSSEISREDTSSDEDDDYRFPSVNEVPDYGYPRVPDYGLPRVPDYGLPRVPDYEQPGVPDYVHPRVPDYQHPRVPDYQQPRVPDYEQHGVPDYEHPRVPDYVHPRVPDYVHPRVPDYVHPRVPDYQQPRVPDYEHPGVPDYAHPGVPDYAHPGVPDYEEAVTPEEEFPAVPDYEGPMMPGLGVGIDTRLEGHSSKGAEEGGSNTEDPTSVLPYSDSSQSADSRGLNLEDDQIFTGDNQTTSLHEETNGPAGVDYNPQRTLSQEGFVDQSRTVEDTTKEDQTAEKHSETDLTTFTTQEDSDSEDQGRYEDQYSFPEDNSYEDDDLSDYNQEGNDEIGSEFSRAGSNQRSSSESVEMGLDASVVEADNDHDDDEEDSSEDVTNRSQAEDDWPRAEEDTGANYSL